MNSIFYPYAWIIRKNPNIPEVSNVSEYIFFEESTGINYLLRVGEDLCDNHKHFKKVEIFYNGEEHVTNIQVHTPIGEYTALELIPIPVVED